MHRVYVKIVIRYLAQDKILMKKLRFLLPTLILSVAFVASADAQATRARKATAKKTTSKTIPPLDVRAAREKVDVQLSNVNDFVNKLGTIAQGLEVADADAKAGSLKPATAAKINAKKTEIVEAIRNIKQALGNLESEFRTKRILQKYLPSIEGITDLSAESEDLAITGKFVAAKDPLRQTAKKLSDTLAIMPR